MRRIAVVGSGIAGLAAAHRLSAHAHVTLFEAGAHFGGHTHTVDLTLDGVTHGVDTGFLVFNERTYPNLIRLFGELGIDSAPSEMSFSVQVRPAGLEWSGSNLDTVFAQRANLFEPCFWGMLADLLRFNRLVTRIAERGGEHHYASMSVGGFLDAHGFGSAFREMYLLPMIGCIWSCPVEQMPSFPVATLIRFFHNHGLAQVANRPRWMTVPGGARRYVQRIVERLSDARLHTAVRRVRRVPAGRGDSGVWVDLDGGAERFDEVVLACHSDQALALLDAPSAAEREVLGAIGYQRNRAVLHTDASMLPTRRRAWAAWNCERAADDDGDGICLHYLINRLQPLPWATPVIVSLNPLREPDTARVHAEIEYEHPVLDRQAIAAQARIGELQGRSHLWFCGAWAGYGFHEDGVVSGLAVANALIERMKRAVPQRQAAA